MIRAVAGEAVLKGISTDNHFFAVRAVGRMALARLQCRRKWSGVHPHSPHRTNSNLQQLIVVQVGYQRVCIGAHSVGKLDLGTIADVGFDLLPLIAFLNFLARSTNRENAGQSFHVGESFCSSAIS